MNQDIFPQNMEKLYMAKNRAYLDTKPHNPFLLSIPVQTLLSSEDDWVVLILLLFLVWVWLFLSDYWILLHAGSQKLFCLRGSGGNCSLLKALLLWDIGPTLVQLNSARGNRFTGRGGCRLLFAFLFCFAFALGFSFSCDSFLEGLVKMGFARSCVLGVKLFV